MRFVATLGFSRGGHLLAMVKKNTQKLPHLNGKWNGIGGKMEIGESPVGAAMREFTEETGITVAKDEMVFVEHQRFINGILGGTRCVGDEIYWYAIMLPWNTYLPSHNDVREELGWLGLHHGRVETGWDESRLCPNLDYLVPKALVFLRTPYLDRPA